MSKPTREGVEDRLFDIEQEIERLEDEKKELEELYETLPEEEE